MSGTTPRERVLAAMRREEVDYVPLVGAFNPLTEQQRVGHKYQFPWGPSGREQCEYCVQELGIDINVSFGISNTNPAADVSSRVWMEDSVIHKVWTTPAGELHSSVKYDEKWPHGLDIHFFSDFNIGHTVDRWIENEQDLDCLRHVLRAPEDAQTLEKIRFDFMETKRLADRFQLPIVLTAGLGLSGAQHLFGASELCIKTIENPGLVQAYVDYEHGINLRLIEMAADLGVDAIRRNGFYETADFYSPVMLDRFLGKPLREEIEAAHRHGKPIMYTMHTGVMPILDHLDGLPFDCLQGIDIAFKDMDIRKLRDSQHDKKSFMIGPSSTYHIWKDDPELTRGAVRQCFEVFGRRGLIITPCVSVHSIMPWQSALAMIDEWKKLRGA